MKKIYNRLGILSVLCVERVGKLACVVDKNQLQGVIPPPPPPPPTHTHTQALFKDSLKLNFMTKAFFSILYIKYVSSLIFFE